MKTASLLAILALSPIACFAEHDVGAEADTDEPAAEHGEGGASSGGGVDSVFARACERLHGDCSSVCDNPFFECYEDVATCTEQWRLDYLSDYAAPLVDDERVARCGAQVDEQACTDLRPDTPECEFAIVERCVGDGDAYGAIYSPFTPGSAVLGETIELQLCQSIEEFFAIELEQGATLEVIGDDSTPQPSFIDRIEMVTTEDGDVVIERSDLDTPTAHAGTYLIGVHSGMAGMFRFAIVPLQ